MTKQKYSYSLWLRPAQEQIDELTKIISALAHRYQRIIFPPHITLLSGIRADVRTITSICEQIIEPHPAFNIKLENIAYTNEYFRNLYILAKSEKKLSNLYNEMNIRFEHNISETFIPHISLLYGSLDSEKQQLISKELSNSYSRFFDCQRLDLFDTTGKEKEWHLIKSYYFT